MSHAEKGMPKEGADENQMPTSEGEAEKSQPEWLAEVASLISNSNNPFVRGYSRAMVPALQPKDIFQSIVAAQLTAAHTLALQQASAAATAEFLPQLEHFTRAFGELSRLTIELTNSYIKMQNNTQINQINIENVSVEKGAQAIVGCVTNAPTALAQSREADKEHLEVSRRRIRSKDRTGTSGAGEIVGISRRCFGAPAAEPRPAGGRLVDRPRGAESRAAACMAEHKGQERRLKIGMLGSTDFFGEKRSPKGGSLGNS